LPADAQNEFSQKLGAGRNFDILTNDGRANLPVCPNLTASQRSNAGGTMGIRTREHRSTRSGGSLGGAAEIVSKL
jgi:hypothetical protein